MAVPGGILGGIYLIFVYFWMGLCVPPPPPPLPNPKLPKQKQQQHTHTLELQVAQVEPPILKYPGSSPGNQQGWNSKLP